MAIESNECSKKAFCQNFKHRDFFFNLFLYILNKEDRMIRQFAKKTTNLHTWKKRLEITPKYTTQTCQFELRSQQRHEMILLLFIPAHASHAVPLLPWVYFIMFCKHLEIKINLARSHLLCVCVFSWTNLSTQSRKCVPIYREMCVYVHVYFKWKSFILRPLLPLGLFCYW